MKIVWGICGSYCNHQAVLKEISRLNNIGYEIQAVLSENTIKYSTRFGKSDDFITELEKITNKNIFKNIIESETVGPSNEFDVCVIAPCTASTLSKLINGDYDHNVTLCAKSILRNNMPVVIGIASNDMLGISGKNLMLLAQIKNIYIVPFYQDDFVNKPNSCISKWDLIEKTIMKSLNKVQIQPILYRKDEEYD